MSTAVSTEASSKMIAGAFPPSSKQYFFKLVFPCSSIFLPVAQEPTAERMAGILLLDRA